MTTIDLLREEVRSSSLSGWRKALYIVVLTREGMTAAAISAAVDVPGFSTPVVNQHLDAVDLAIMSGVLPALDRITADTPLPTDVFDAYYSGIGRDDRYQSIPDRDRIAELAAQEGVGASKALDIAKNPKALGIAFRASGRAQQAVLGAMEFVSDEVLEALINEAVMLRGERQAPGHRIRMAHLRELSEQIDDERHPSFIWDDRAVVINGTVFTFDSPFEAVQFQEAYSAVRGERPLLLSEVTVDKDEAWASLREQREAQVGRALSSDEWRDYVMSL